MRKAHGRSGFKNQNSSTAPARRESIRPGTVVCSGTRHALGHRPTEIIDRMQAVKPDLVRATIPRRGHAPFLDEPESLAAIDAFIDGLA
jgi:hypothetical protein